MIQIYFYECVNTTDINTCQSPEVIKSFLMKPIITIYSIETYIQTDDYENPFEKGLKQDFFQSSYDNEMSITMYLNHLKVVSDKGVLSSYFTEQKDFQQNKMLDFATQKNGGKFMSFTMQLDNIEMIYYRKYYKLLDLAAQVGGILKTIIIALSVIIQFHTDHSSYQHLLNHFFYVQFDKNTPIKKLNKTTTSYKSDEKDNHNLSPKSSRISDRTANNLKKDKTFEDLKKFQRDCFHFTFWDKLFIFDCFRKCSTAKKKKQDYI